MEMGMVGEITGSSGSQLTTLTLLLRTARIIFLSKKNPGIITGSWPGEDFSGDCTLDINFCG